MLMKLCHKKYMTGSPFENMEVTYKHEAKLGDTISCFYTKTGDNEHIVNIKNKETNSIHAIVKLY